MNYPREQAQTQAHQQQPTGTHPVVNAPPHTHTDPMTTSTASSPSSSSSSKSNKSKSIKSKTALATSEFESSPYHKKKQLQHQQKDRAHRDDIMIPSISKHRYSPSPGNSSSNSSSNSISNSISRQRANSPASCKKSSSPISIEDKKRLQESLLLLSPVTNNNSKMNVSTDNNNNNNNNVIDLPPLIPIEVVDMVDDDDNNNNNNNNTYNINIPTGMTARLSMTSQGVGEEMLDSGYASSCSEDEDISKYGYGDDNTPAVAEQQYQLQQQYNNEQQQQQLQEEQKQEEYDDYGVYEEEEASSPNDNTFNSDDEEADEADSAAKYGYGDCELSTSTNTAEEEALIDQLLSSQYSATNELSSTAFCPNRMPRRSSMKSSSPSSRSSSNTSRGSRRRSASIDEDLLAMPSISNTSRIKEDHIEVLLPGRPKHDTVRRRRSITFDNDVDVQKIEPIKSLAGKDGSKSLWFQENEYETIKIKTLALLDRVDHSSGIIDGRKYCTRGLEKFMTPEATEVKKHQAWDSVLNEQFLQRKDGEYDEETLANIYKYSTKRSRSEASKRAVQDAVAAEAYLKTTFLRRQSYDKNGAHFNRRCSM
jgi:hypothetical protein